MPQRLSDREKSQRATERRKLKARKVKAAEDAKQRRADERAMAGSRLAAVLDANDWSQSDVERRTNGVVKQKHLSEMMRKKNPRTINAAHLRALGKIGISPEYLLGLVGANIPPGQVRPMVDLHTDLASHLSAAVGNALAAGEPSAVHRGVASVPKEVYRGRVILERLTEDVRDEAWKIVRHRRVTDDITTAMMAVQVAENKTFKDPAAPAVQQMVDSGVNRLIDVLHSLEEPSLHFLAWPKESDEWENEYRVELREIVAKEEELDTRIDREIAEGKRSPDAW
jgi:hypothetical protein